MEYRAVSRTVSSDSPPVSGGATTDVSLGRDEHSTRYEHQWKETDPVTID
ncbi:hypothetical protein [Natrinema gelatinilyticum]|nr:hypothetical protein [Natrinema gelatinilyticum]